MPRRTQEVMGAPEIAVDPSFEEPAVLGASGGGSAVGAQTRIQIDNPGAGTSPAPPDITGQYESLANQQANAETPALDTTGMVQEVEQNAAIKSADSFTDPGMFVENRLNNLLESDNPLLKRSKALGDMAAQSIGLTDSLAGQRMGLGLMYDKGLEIAKQDAATLADFGKQEQQASNQQQLTQTEAIVSGKLNQQEWGQQNISEGFDIAKYGIDTQVAQNFEMLQQNVQRGYEAMQADLDRQLQERLQRNEINASVAESVRQQQSQIMQNHQVAVEELLGNVEFLDMGPEAVAAMLNRLAQGMYGTMQYIQDTAGLGTPTTAWYLNNVRELWEF